jgi:hypothetical protein
VSEPRRTDAAREWTFLFEVRWYHGDRFIQRFGAWHVDHHPRVVWENAWALFRLQEAWKQLRRALVARAAEARDR